MNRGSAFQRQGVLGTERRPYSEEKLWKLNGRTAWRDLHVSSRTLKSVRKRGTPAVRRWWAGVRWAAECYINCSQRRCCCLTTAMLPCQNFSILILNNLITLRKFSVFLNATSYWKKVANEMKMNEFMVSDNTRTSVCYSNCTYLPDVLDTPLLIYSLSPIFILLHLTSLLSILQQ